MTHKHLAIVFLVSASILGCTSVPKGLEPVSEFDGDRYLGKWYEIARLDHSFEKNLSNVSAIYSAKENGEISVVNRGYNKKTGEWKQIEGKARFIGEETVGSLKVSFFGPFYGGYHVIALDKENYSYAMVSGPSRSYLWILSRTTSLNEDIYSRLVDQAAKMGFDTLELIKVKHDRSAKYRKLEGKAKMVSRQENILTPCPKTPNCVSTLADWKDRIQGYRKSPGSVLPIPASAPQALYVNYQNTGGCGSGQKETAGDFSIEIAINPGTSPVYSGCCQYKIS